MSELDRLIGAHARIATPSPSQREAARALLAAQWEPSATASRRVAGEARRRRFGAVVATALAAAVVVALWPSGSGPGSGSVRPVSVASAASVCRSSAHGPGAACLRAIGAVAAVQGTPSVDDVVYQRAIWSVSFVRVGPHRGGRVDRRLRGAKAAFGITRYGTEETWVAPGRGARVQYSVEGHARPATVADARVWRASGSPDLDRIMGPRGGWGPRVQTVRPSGISELLLGTGALNEVLPSPDPLRGLPVEPAALHERLRTLAWRQRTERSGDGDGACKQRLSDCPPTYRALFEEFALIDATTLLRYPFAGPALRKALFGVLATIPGVRSLGTLRDPAGRLGAAIFLPGHGPDGQNVALFATRTSRLLAVGAADAPRVDHIQWSRIERVAAATVGRIGERPPRHRAR